MSSAHLGELFPRDEDIPQDHRLEPVVQREYLCAGQLAHWSGPLQPVTSPIWLTTESGLVPNEIGRYPLLTAEVSLNVLDAAVGAYGDGRGRWPTMRVEERIGHLEEFADQMAAKRTEVVRLLMWEIGKSLTDSEKEFDRTLEYVRATIAAVKEMNRSSSRFLVEEGVLGQIRHGPLGVVLCMGPYNYPLNETFATLIPALIMGNTVIFKPPKLGVLLHRPLLEAFCHAFPAGVVNTVYGDGATVVGPLMASGQIQVLAFIGTSRVADLLRRAHPKLHRLRCVLGLEAKNAGIVLADADLDLTVGECVLGALSFNGQRCTALKILFVQRAIVDAFLERLCAAVDALRCGMPWEPGVHITPLPEPGKTAYLAELIDDAVRRGAQVINRGGGEVVGPLMRPAVVYPVAPGMRLYDEEQFGPVVPVCAFDDPEEPLRYVADSPYGQQASVFGTSARSLAALVDPLIHQVCRVNINSQCQRGPDTFPFNGRTDSAEGTLSVTDALDAFSIKTVVAAKNNERNQAIINEILSNKYSMYLSGDLFV